MFRNTPLFSNSLRQVFPVIVFVGTAYLAFKLGQRIAIGGGKSILLIPIVLILPIAWSLIPPPRFFKVFCFALVLMPLSFNLPFKALDLIPGFNVLPFFGQVVFALAIVLLVWSNLYRRFATMPRSTWLGLFLFLLGGLLAMIDAPNPEGQTANWWGLVCLLPVCVLIVSSRVVYSIEQAEKLLGIIVVSMAAFGIGMFVVLKTGIFVEQTQSNWLLSHSRLGGNFIFNLPMPFLRQMNISIGGNAPQLGEFMAMGLVISFVYLICAKARSIRRKAMILTLLLTVLMVVTNSRGAFLGAAAGILVVYIAGIVWKASVYKLPVYVFVIIIIVSIVTVTKWAELGPHGQNTINRIMELGNINAADSFINRQKLWHRGFQLLIERPIGLSFWGPLKSEMLNPHNLLIWIVQGTGVIGLVGFLIVLSSIFRRILWGLRHNNDRQRVLSISLFGVLVGVLVVGIGSVFFQTAYIVTTFWAVMGMAFIIDKPAV